MNVSSRDVDMVNTLFGDSIPRGAVTSHNLVCQTERKSRSAPRNFAQPDLPNLRAGHGISVFG